MPPRRASAAAGITKAKMFKKPSPAQMAQLYNELKSNNKNGAIVRSPTNNNLSPNNQGLTRRHFYSLYQGKARFGVYPSNVEVYIQFVCDYVNRTHNRNGVGQIPVCAVKDSAFFKTYHDAFIALTDTSAASTQLTQDGLGPNNFLQVRHLFLVDRTIFRHLALVVISPQARTVDLLDSAVRHDDGRIGLVLRLISDHLGDQFLPHEWKVRMGSSPEQGTTNDCSAYVMTNAMLIAFGCPIQYSRTDMVNRRYRIAADLMNGTNGMFYVPPANGIVPAAQEQYYYGLTDYWTGSKASDRSRGFQSISDSMLEFLPRAVQAKAKAGKYR